MREIKAIIQPFLADKVLDALRQLADLPGVTVSEVRGYGRQQHRRTSEREKGAGVFGEEKIKLEFVVPDRLVEQVMETISKAAHTGNPGDGKIFVYPVWDVVRIRTGDRGEQAI